MVLAVRLAAGYGDDDQFVVGWREELGPYTCAVDMPGSPGYEVRLCCCERVPQIYPPLVGGRVGGEDVYVCWPLISKCPGLDECTTQLVLRASVPELAEAPA